MCFFDKFDSLCRAHGKSANGVAKELGLSSGVVTTWKQNKTTPRHTTIKKIADYFHMSVDALMRGVGDGMTEPAGHRPLSDDEIKYAFFGGDAGIMTEEDMEDVRKVAAILIERRKRGQT